MLFPFEVVAGALASRHDEVGICRAQPAPPRPEACRAKGKQLKHRCATTPFCSGRKEKLFFCPTSEPYFERSTSARSALSVASDELPPHLERHLQLGVEDGRARPKQINAVETDMYVRLVEVRAGVLGLAGTRAARDGAKHSQLVLQARLVARGSGILQRPLPKRIISDAAVAATRPVRVPAARL